MFASTLVVASLLLLLFGSAAPAYGQEQALRSSGADEASRPARSEAPPEGADDDDEEEEAVEASPLSVAASILPGPLFPGAGHHVMGEHEMGWTLFGLGALGLGGTIGGLALTAATGASRYIVGTSVALTITGFSLFAGSIAADIFGSATGEDASGRTMGELPRVRSELGYRFIYDAQFDHRHFIVSEAAIAAGRFRFQPLYWTAVSGDPYQLQLDSSYRPIGPRVRPEVLATSGSSLDLGNRIGKYAYADEGFEVLYGEIYADGRLDLASFARTLKGAFVGIELGYGYEFYNYDVPGLELGDDARENLLYESTFGFYLANRGEVSMTYSHRRDTFAGGGAFAGKFGVQGTYMFSRALGVEAEVDLGSALVTGFGVVYAY